MTPARCSCLIRGLLRLLLLLGEEFVVYFPTHWVLHR
jgi:hypothetical protein